MKTHLLSFVILAALIAATKQETCEGSSKALPGRTCNEYKWCQNKEYKYRNCQGTNIMFDNVTGTCVANDGTCPDHCKPSNKCTDNCNSTTASYTCSCKPGRVLGADTFTCNAPVSPTDHCKPSNKCTDNCNSTTASYKCSCKPGRVLGADTFTCNAPVSPIVCNLECGTHGQCAVLASGEKTCFCNPGYTGIPCNPVCSLNCGLHGECTRNAENVESCQCSTGYDGPICQYTGASTGCSCVKGTCKLKEGLPYCHCPDGYGGSTCEEQTFILLCPKVCSNRGKCQSVGGQQKCSCKNGFMGDVCNKVANPCAYKNCGKGSCSIVSNMPTCVCDADYIGPNCDKVSKCKSHFCANGGICKEDSGEPSCTCVGEFAGPKCQFPKCGNSYCEHGTCGTSGGTSTCTCGNGWEGDRCEKKKLQGNLCDIFPCQNGATCEFLDTGNAKCNCAPHFTGMLCTEKVTCDGVECLNGGVCEIKDNKPWCDCPASVEGDKCQHRINCQDGNSPCENNGICKTGDLGFSCDCPLPYTGIVCEKGIKCADDILQCRNGGTCNDAPLAQCECAGGFTGKTCNVKNDACGGCQNGGLCIPTIVTTADAELVCSCNHAYTGDHCEKVVPDGKKISCPNTFGYSDDKVVLIYPDTEDFEKVFVCQKGKIQHLRYCPGTIYDAATKSCLTVANWETILEAAGTAHDNIVNAV